MDTYLYITQLIAFLPFGHWARVVHSAKSIGFHEQRLESLGPNNNSSLSAFATRRGMLSSQYTSPNLIFLPLDLLITKTSIYMQTTWPTRETFRNNLWRNKWVKKGQCNTCAQNEARTTQFVGSISFWSSSGKRIDSLVNTFEFHHHNQQSLRFSNIMLGLVVSPKCSLIYIIDFVKLVFINVSHILLIVKKVKEMHAIMYNIFNNFAKKLLLVGRVPNRK